MFDRYKEALLTGHFQIPVQLEELTDGRYLASYTSPQGQTVTAVHEDRAEANRRCMDQLRNGVMNGQVELGH